MTPFYWFGYWVTKILYLILYHVTYEGQEKVPATGGYLIVANHRFLKDPLLLAHGLRRQVYFMGKKEFFQNPFLRVIFTWLGVFPVDRGSGDMGAIGRGVELVRQGKLVGLFPEGTRTKTGKLGVIKSGAFVIAAAAGADMLPVRIIYGTKDGRLHLFCKLRIVFGEPIPAADLQIRDQSHKMAELRRMKNRLRDELEQLLADNAFAVRLAETAAEEPAAPDVKPQLPE